MPVFVTLGRFTPHGREMLAQGQFREQWPKSVAAIEQAGGRLLASYGLLGEYDALVITEWPDEKAYLRGIGGLSRHDVVATQSSVAIPMDQFGDVMSEYARTQ